jgi:signal transduction histidine kinase
MSEAANHANGPAPAEVTPPSPREEMPEPMRRSVLPVLTIRWHESWIIRAAGLASLILMIGYVSSAFFAITSIDSIAKLAHDDDIEQSLAAHLESIKRAHTLEQQLILERLKPELHAWAAATPGSDALSEERVKAFLAAAHVGDIISVEESTIKLAREPDPKAGRTELAWIDRDRLRLGPWVLEFPKGQAYGSFKAAEDIRQRYQLVGAKLDDDIRPTLIRAMTGILIVSFFLLASLFIVYAQRFKARIGEVLEGFSLWSEKDAKFRFVGLYRGELRLITAQFNAMADEVEANRQRSLYLEKIASWQIIARKLAHEIKNPLTPIQMMVSQLKRRYKGGDEAFGKLLDEAQHIITEEVAGLRRMVDNFSNFARLPEPAPRPTDLVVTCRHVVELQRNAFQHHQFAFESQLKTATAVVDEDLLRQVLINLIKNAAEACGETPSKITVGLTDSGLDLLVSVRDNGPGIPPELQERIFEAYFTTKHTGPNPGMGLGLAVCQKIVMDHAGKMSVRSRPGETVFTIRLPRRKKDL